MTKINIRKIIRIICAFYCFMRSGFLKLFVKYTGYMKKNFNYSLMELSKKLTTLVIM